jgi:hypothetical protein
MVGVGGAGLAVGVAGLGVLVGPNWTGPGRVLEGSGLVVA